MQKIEPLEKKKKSVSVSDWHDWHNKRLYLFLNEQQRTENGVWRPWGEEKSKCCLEIPVLVTENKTGHDHRLPFCHKHSLSVSSNIFLSCLNHPQCWLWQMRCLCCLELRPTSVQQHIMTWNMNIIWHILLPCYFGRYLWFAQLFIVGFFSWWLGCGTIRPQVDRPKWQQVGFEGALKSLVLEK